MAEYTVNIDDDVREVLEILARLKGMPMKQYLKTRTTDDIERIKQRLKDPLIGALSGFSHGENDVSSRTDDIIYEEWRPD